MDNKWIIIACLCVLLGAVLGFTLGLTVNQASETEESAPVEAQTLRYIAFKIYDPVYIAYDKGFFEERGVKVEILDTLAGGPTALQAIAGGSAEAGVSSIMAIINARAQGLPVIGVSDLQSAIGEQPLEEFFVLDDSGIYSIADLKGKTIAINLAHSSFHYTWLMALEQHGLQEDEVEFILLPFEQQELALLNGQVDAIGLMPPYILHAKSQPNVRLLFDAFDVFGEKQFSTHVINSVWAESNLELAEAFVTAIADAVQWIEANQAEAAEIVSRHTGVEARWIGDYFFQENAVVIYEDSQFWLDYMRDAGHLDNDWLQVSDFMTNSFNQVINSVR